MTTAPALIPGLTPTLPGDKPKPTNPADKARSTSQDFEAMFLNSMLQPMFNGVNEGPFSGGQGASVWRSFLTDEYSKMIVKNGGVGIADQVYRSLLAQQEVRSAHATGAQQGSPAL